MIRLLSGLSEIFDEYFKTENTFLKYSLCYRILWLLSESSLLEGKGSSNELFHVLDFIKLNYTKKLTIATLAAIANTSEANFYLIFKKQFGLSPIAYLNSYRLAIASERLVETELSVGEIGASVGICDPLYFSKLFKKSYGLSPKEYRKERLKKQ